LEQLAAFGRQHRIKLVRRQSKGRYVIEAFFQPQGGQEFPIELVDSEHFAKGDGKVDFDVNNLKLQPPTAKNGEDFIAHKFANQGGSVPTIVQNARSRKLCVLKNPGEVSERIDKMRGRGWKIIGFSTRAGG
jgi:hypothetical protein